MTDSRKESKPAPWKGESRPDRSGQDAPDPTPPPRTDRLWPALIIAGMLVVIAVNAAFIWIAVDGADEVVPSYMEEAR